MSDANKQSVEREWLWNYFWKSPIGEIPCKINTVTGDRRNITLTAARSEASSAMYYHAGQTLDVAGSEIDARKPERCKYRHDWHVRFGEHPLPYKHIECAKCGYEPEPESKLGKEAEAIVTLRTMLKPGDTVYTILKSVSRSGMSRNIDVYCIQDGKPRWIAGYVGHAIGSPQSEKNWERSQGLTVKGCGMDMGFRVVYTLGRVLFPEGFKNQNGEHKDGGYALRHEWL